MVSAEDLISGEPSNQSSGNGREAGRSVEPPKVLRDLAAEADVHFNGDRPWDIQVFHPSVYRRILLQGSLGFGESFMDGLWTSRRLDETIYRLLSSDLDQRINRRIRLRWMGALLRNLLFNRQSRKRAFQVGEQHYDIGNDIYTAMLDSTMSYSCGYWPRADSLEQAQRAKLDLICRKLNLRPGLRLLDIGCGWGGLARHAAEHYGVTVDGITVSREQLTLARQRCDGLPVNLQLMDYRDLDGRYDRVVSVGMFEHVGPKNYATFFQTVDRVLDDQGIFLLHTIGEQNDTIATDPWIDKYIFPNGKIPSPQRLIAAFQPGFVLEDWHNFGGDYDRTLMAWWKRFDAAWPSLQGRYDQRFYRMWKYYLHSCAGYFRSRQGQLWQLVLTKRKRPPTYRSLR
ncbi:cyclopropane fatty acyl phospholipid synthase [Sedimenticola thiotaurini]|uniref:Cyclopropane fatty acyl phospholipid synthase n=1 Tax=Sedimenticola thiotaurini TaxID=1543721 RepID=A0A0F7JV06_9GAMM|nr:cyclopropane fatty acyl phospholipid synthase [Sedimenticola thiotaurini]AKH19149.1 cyclopropane fatty acyl phospholipid synthase [Sedimenticola thiotaurini]